MDSRLFLFVLGVSCLTGILFGMASSSRAARGDVADSLKESARSTTAGRSRQAFQRSLISVEFALALVLLVGAGLLIKGFSKLRTVAPGFTPDNLTTMRVQLPETRYRSIPSQTNFRRELQERLNSLPGMQAAMITDLPLDGNYVSHGIVMEGRPPVPVGSEPQVQDLSIMGDYFHVMQIPLRAGRAFTPADREGEPLVAIVNEEFVREFLGHENPLGVRVDWSRNDEPHKWMTIVGVAADVRQAGLNLPVDPALYTPYAQTDERWKRWMTLVIRSRDLPATGLVESVKKQVWALDREIPVAEVRSMTDLMARSIAEQRFTMLLLEFFAGLALALASVGVYGLVSYRVGQRWHEIGVRMALGAQRRHVMRLAVADGAKLALFGIAAGVLAALGLTRLMTSLLFEVKPTDPTTFVLVTLVLALVAMAASFLPARRATRVDPVVALRNE